MYGEQDMCGATKADLWRSPESTPEDLGSSSGHSPRDTENGMCLAKPSFHVRFPLSPFLSFSFVHTQFFTISSGCC